MPVRLSPNVSSILFRRREAFERLVRIYVWRATLLGLSRPTALVRSLPWVDGRRGPHPALPSLDLLLAVVLLKALVAAAELAVASAARVATVLVVLIVAEAALALTAFTITGPIAPSAELATALTPSGSVIGTHILIVVAPSLAAGLALIAIAFVAPGATFTIVVAEPSSWRSIGAATWGRTEATIGTIEPFAVRTSPTRTRVDGTPRQEHASAVRADPEATVEGVAYDAHVGEDAHAGELRRADGGRLRRRDRRAAHRGCRYQQMKPSHVMPFEESTVRIAASGVWLSHDGRVCALNGTFTRYSLPRRASAV